ncbi:MAG TPA: alpha-2-macroglobulin family protein, partial [Gemmatimonadales bacterium]|nr:alpha-2-macroglobulin family protein [Gemmatimonadales bacterium]
KRRRDKPVAFWSGVQDAGADGGDFTFTAPDYFNGTLRIMAVAVNGEAVGAAEVRSVVRGDFVLSPNVPLMVAPGDTFDVSVGVANNIANSGKGARIQVGLDVPPALQVLGPPSTVVAVDAMAEGAVVFHVRATEKLGDADLTFTARLGDKSARLMQSLSLRPAVPYRTALTTGTVKQGSATAALERDLYPELRSVRGAISVVPLGLARGLAEYLRKYPYGCTEQLVSQGVPAMVLARRPEFGITTVEAATSFGKVVDMLRSRQNEEGAYGLWAANAHVDPYVSVYAQHFLLDARERGFAVPPEVLANGWRYLIHLASTEGNSLAEERVRAYAIYLLTRSGIVTTGFATALDRRVRTNYANQWNQDLTAAFLASTYQLLKQEGLAATIMDGVHFQPARVPAYEDYDDALTHDAMLLYLLSRHFPSRLPALQAQAIAGIVGPIQSGAFNSLSSASAILGLDAYVTAAGPQAAGRFTLTETMPDGSRHPLVLSAGTFPEASITRGARKVTFGSEAPGPAFYLLNQSGFDRTVPAKPLTQGLEVLREYTDMSGAPVSSVNLGDEIQVHLKFRALGKTWGSSVALVDLLPGGFEIVEDGARAQQPAVVMPPPPDSTNAGEADGGEGDAEGGEGAWTPPFGQVVGNWSPEYVEAREDRVVVYGYAQQAVQEFVYTVKATAAGSFAVPPAFGEGMYDRGVRAWSQSGRMVVKPR